MVNGPPTPPPTTEAELRDNEAPGNAAPPPESSGTSNAPAGSSSAPTGDDVFQRVFPNLLELATSPNYAKLAETAEKVDLSAVRDNEYRLTRFFVTAPLVLSYLIVDNLSPARYALLRLPDRLQLSSLGQALINLVAATSERKYTDIYARAEDLFQLAGSTTFPDPNLAKLISDLVSRFVESFRTKTSALLNNAYASLPLSLAQVYLGLSAEQVLNVAQNLGWSYDSATNVLTLSSGKPQNTKFSARGSVSTLEMFQFVTDSVVRQEL